MSGALRRIVTGDNAAGRSFAVIDGGPAKAVSAGGSGLFEIWSAALSEAGILDSEDRLASADLRLEPDPGQVKVRWFSVPPEDDRPAHEKDAAAAFGFAMAGAAHARVDTTRHPMMHKTDTLDVIVIIDGAVDLLLDEGEPLSLKPGDVVIQRATNHAWLNHGDGPALLVAVLMKAGGA